MSEVETRFGHEIHVEDDLLIWRINGPLNAGNYDVIKEDLLRFLKDDRKGMILDVGGCDAIDSRGLSFLLIAQKEMRAKDGRVVLARLNAKFAALFEMTRLNRIFEIFLDLETAKNSFGVRRRNHAANAEVETNQT